LYREILSLILIKAQLKLRPRIKSLRLFRCQCQMNRELARSAQILVARSPWPLNIVWWRRIYVGPQNWTCSMSPFWQNG